MSATPITPTGVSMPSLAALIETRIVRIKYAHSQEAIIAVLCEQLKAVTPDSDIHRMADVAQRCAGLIPGAKCSDCMRQEALS